MWPARATKNSPNAPAAALLILWFVCAAPLSAAEREVEASDEQFTRDVLPLLKTRCFSCHGPTKQEGKLKLSEFANSGAVAAQPHVWQRVLERLQTGDMPPEDAPQPTAKERRIAAEWIERRQEIDAERNAGDPGIVLARRLSNAELDYTIRDLTGQNIRPSREFPVDPANEAGFDNSGESLAMSPALLKKQLAAARLVSEHLVLLPQGFVFAPHPTVTETDRDKYCVQRIIDFYERRKVDYADYFFTAWQYNLRQKLGKPDATLEDFAAGANLSPKYLAIVWSALTEPMPEPGPLGETRKAWRDLPADPQSVADVRQACREMRDLVLKLRKALVAPVEKIHVSGISDGSQPLVLWQNKQSSRRHMRYEGAATGEEAAALRRFCHDFPAAFYVSDRGPYFDPKAAGQGRLLTAGFHLMQGYFRDDQPLCELVLSDEQRRELDRLWQELNFVTLVPQRQYKDFIFFERAEPPRFMREAEFDFARSEDKDVTSDEKMKRLCEAYLAKAKRNGASDQAAEAIETYFSDIAKQIRWVEEARPSAEPSHLESLGKFAERAYRRPLASGEREELRSFYRRLREQDGLPHEEAMRDCIASVLVSPHFAYRIDLAAPGTNIVPLSDYALASRLSYFLWSSMPDEELLAQAAAGKLHEAEVLHAQTRRMLRDQRVRGLAIEFGGNWLDFRRFQEHNSVDRERFPSFTNELRQAMFEEPVRFFVDVLQNNRSVLEFIEARHTFINPVLAKHYGMPVLGDADGWARVDDADRYGRGGLLAMSVFLTKNAPGLRTSPVKRGYWVVRRVLGEQIPPPPPDVPELPQDEAKLELTLPQLLAKHREHKNCAACHQRFDSLGLAFEGYGPIGERRELDLAGRTVETQAMFPDGVGREGVPGLREYLRERRCDEFIDNLCRKMSSYALGRSLILSDRKALRDMRARLVAEEYAMGSLIESIVISPQFLNQRGRDAGE
jgi:mono/diheme cytochrome c family protein